MPKQFYWPKFDPEGSEYDYRTAIESGDKPDTSGHWHSLDPRTGMVLKGRQHETWNKTIEAEKALGNIVVKGPNGRYYSMPKDTKGAPVEKWKLTPEQKSFQQKFKTLTGLRNMLMSEQFRIQYEAENLQELFKMLDGQMKGLKIPENGTHDLSDQDFPNEGKPEDFSIRY